MRLSLSRPESYAFKSMSRVLSLQVTQESSSQDLMVNSICVRILKNFKSHFIMSNLISLKNLEVFVLDEADNLLQDTSWMMCVPCLNGLDFLRRISKLSAEVLKPDSVMISNKKLVSANSRVAQRFMLVAKEGKKDALLELLQKEIEDSKTKDPQNPTLKRTLVFVRTKRDADLISLYLSGKDIKATTINGDRPQALREQALREFRNNEVKVLVATDVCARGLDIKDLDHVINFDLPNDDVTYVHRIGRTGRIRNGLVEFVRGVGQEPPEFLRKVVDGSGLGSYQEKAAVAQQADDGW
uniref:Helicase C-terminal domain-containing protein n=1 Tax=Ditylenchus dipsaci TaxID=166011 RepID=A0A915E3P7_9BILA